MILTMIVLAAGASASPGNPGSPNIQPTFPPVQHTASHGWIWFVVLGAVLLIALAFFAARARSRTTPR